MFASVRCGGPKHRAPWKPIRLQTLRSLDRHLPKWAGEESPETREAARQRESGAQRFRGYREIAWCLDFSFAHPPLSQDGTGDLLNSPRLSQVFDTSTAC